MRYRLIAATLALLATSSVASAADLGDVTLNYGTIRGSRQLSGILDYATSQPAYSIVYLDRYFGLPSNAEGASAATPYVVGSLPDPGYITVAVDFALSSAYDFTFSPSYGGYARFADYALYKDGLKLDPFGLTSLLGPGHYDLVLGTPTQGVQFAGFSFSLAPSAVPEPASWAMMLAGLFIVNAAMRRRNGAALLPRATA